MKIYITKYALTEGILTGTAAVIDGNMASVYVLHDSKGRVFNEVTTKQYHFHNRDWHKTRTDAVARAEDMKQKKIRCLERNLRKIQELTFK